jgi:hypothetical protein
MLKLSGVFKRFGALLAIDNLSSCQRALNRHIHIVLFGTKLARSQPNNPLEVKGELALV